MSSRLVPTSTTSSVSTSSLPSSRSAAPARSSGAAPAPVSTGLLAPAEPLRWTGQRLDEPRTERGHEQSRRLRQVGGEHADAAGVGQDGQPRAGRPWLLLEQQRRGREVGGSLATDHTGLRDHRVHGDGVRGRRGGVRGAGATPALRAPAQHGQQGLAAREPAGQTRELGRVAEGLQVERRRGDRGVLAPGGQQVVAGDVGLVAERDEGPDPEPDPARLLEQHDADTARLRGDRETARPGDRVAERGVEPGLRQVAHQPQAVRSDHAHVARTGDLQHLRLELAAALAHLAEPRGEHDRRRDAGGHDVGHRPRAGRSRHGEDGQVDPGRQVGAGGVGGEPRDRGGRGVHDVEVAREAAAADGVEHGRPHPGAVASCSQHDDRARVQQRVQRAPLRPGLAPVGHALRAVGRGEVHRELRDAVAGLGAQGEAGVDEDPPHPVVVAEDVGHEPLPAALARQHGQVLQEQAGQPAPVLVVVDQEGDLVGVDAGRLGGAQSDHPVRDHGDEREGAVQAGQHVVDVGVPAAAVGGEEPEAHVLVAGPVVERPQRVPVVRRDRAEARDRAVGGEDVAGSSLHGHSLSSEPMLTCPAYDGQGPKP